MTSAEPVRGPEYWSRDPERLRRFEQEAQATAALNHPNIVSIFHVSQFNGAPYIVTKLLPETLASPKSRTLACRLIAGRPLQVAPSFVVQFWEWAGFLVLVLPYIAENNVAVSYSGVSIGGAYRWVGRQSRVRLLTDRLL